MESLINIKENIISFTFGFWERTQNTYWPIYYGWLAKKLENYDPFSVLTIATSLAVFFFLVFYWARNKF